MSNLPTPVQKMVIPMLRRVLPTLMPNPQEITVILMNDGNIYFTPWRGMVFDINGNNVSVINYNDIKCKQLFENTRNLLHDKTSGLYKHNQSYESIIEFLEVYTIK